MRIDFGQQMRMQQQMRLSPRIIQSMEILQLPLIALEQRIDQELEQNPVLELEDPAETEAAAGLQDGEPAQTSAEDTDQAPLVVTGEGPGSADEFARLDSAGQLYGEGWTDNVQEASDYRPQRVDRSDRDAKMDAMANTPARGLSLHEQLLDQWRYFSLDAAVRAAGEYLLPLIEADGYLRTPWEDVLRHAPAGMAAQDLVQALECIQRQCEPVGLGARNLRECLLIQIEAAGGAESDDPVLHAAHVIVDRYLEDIEMNRLPKIARQAGFSIDLVNQAMQRLRRFQPHPGFELATAQTERIIPDVLVEYDPVHDRYVAGMNQGRTPSLRISPVYQDVVAEKGLDGESRRYLQDRIGKARWLIDALQQRQTTLLRVVNVVIDVQKEFLDHGDEHLRPLPMTQVADQLGIHVGTVSRAVSGKYLQTPRGIFPLRRFFVGGMESADGGEMSWTAVQARLKQLVDDEDATNPYSDDQLVVLMKEQDIKIARRTVAKYRQQLNIPTARQRRKF